MMKLIISILVANGVFASSLPKDQKRRLGYNYGSSSSYGSNSGYRSSSSYNASDVYGKNFFVESQNTYYDGYQQAWRYLGHLVKCGYPTSRYYEESSHSGSQDNDDGRYRGNNYCQRYLLWAAVSSICC